VGCRPNGAVRGDGEVDAGGVQEIDGEKIL